MQSVQLNILLYQVNICLVTFLYLCTDFIIISPEKQSKHLLTVVFFMLLINAITLSFAKIGNICSLAIARLQILPSSIYD